MRKLILIVALLHLSYLTANAQRLYAIVFADITDSAIGKVIKWNQLDFLSLSDKIASDLGYDKEEILRNGKMCSKHTLKKTFKSLKCSPDDIVMFAYFGHGVRAAGDRSQYPQLTLGSTKEKDYVPLEDVKKALVARGAHFVFVVGDCGNTINVNIRPKANVLKVTNSKLLEAKAHVINKANIFNTRGSVIISASSIGENAWADDSGSFFLRSLSRNIENGMNDLSWVDILSKVKEEVESYSLTLSEKMGGRYCSQTPCYTIDIY